MFCLYANLIWLIKIEKKKQQGTGAKSIAQSGWPNRDVLRPFLTTTPIFIPIPMYILFFFFGCMSDARNSGMWISGSCSPDNQHMQMTQQGSLFHFPFSRHYFRAFPASNFTSPAAEWVVDLLGPRLICCSNLYFSGYIYTSISNASTLELIN